MLIADAHADSLMWNRDLNTRSDQGHVDFPRLRQAGVALQCFTVVTEGWPLIDGFGLFAAWHGWPRAARKGPWERACFQLEQMARTCEASDGKALLVRSRADLDGGLADGRVCAVLGMEGAQPLDGRIDRVAELHRRGVRFMGLTHLRDNPLGGTSHPGGRNRGLTRFGTEVVEEMAHLRLGVDLAHASPRLLEDLLARAERGADLRPFCSHTGMGALASPWRNLSDAALRRIADRGGVVGVIFGTVYLGGKTPDDLLRHIDHAISVMGEDGVALGSDFDGMVPLPEGIRDVTDVPTLLAQLGSRGHPARVVEKVAGANLRRFLSEIV